MNFTKKIFYWSPFLVPIATPKAVINSAQALQTYGKEYKCSIINFFGEFNFYRNDLQNKDVKLIDFFNEKIINFFPKYGKFKSRLSFILIFLLSFFPLKNLISKEKPDYMIIHLITSLPLFLLILFKFETKFILRISGFPKINFLRRFLWKKALSKIYMVTCPTKLTADYIESLGIVEKKKIQILYDPIIEIRKINYQKKQKIDFFLKKQKYFFSAGRLTKQKNFLFLCKAFKQILEKYPEMNLLIAGEGEEKNKIVEYINKNKLHDKIILIGFTKNIFNYLQKSEGFILSSLWEDPGFVLVEAAFSRTPIFSSNCINGPKELIINNFNGILFESNNKDDFVNKFEKFIEIKKQSNQLTLNGLKMSKKFTLFNHYKKFNYLLNYERN